MKYRFGNCVIDIERHEVLADGSSIEVEPQVFDLLVLLVRNPGRLISKDELVEVIWNGRSISDSAITSRINAARRTVGDDGFRQAIIATIPRRGIKFVADVETVATAPEVLRSGQEELTSLDPNGAAPLPSAAPASQPTVGVMPFELHGAGAEYAYLAGGIADDISSELGRFHSLAVLSLLSTKNIDNQNDGIDGLLALGATHAVHGAIQSRGERLRITVRLTDLGSLRLIWSERYDIDPGELFDAQDDVVSCIVSTLFGRILDDRTAGARSRPTHSLDAYDCVLRGSAIHRSGLAVSPAELRESMALYDRAIELDPDYARAWAWRACARASLWPKNPDKTDFDDSYYHAAMALSLDPSDAEVHRVMGGVLVYLRQFDSAQYHLEMARKLNPNDAHLLLRGGFYLSYLGDHDRSIRDVERALHRNPLHPNWYWREAGIVFFANGDNRAAVEAFSLLKQKQGRETELVYKAAALVVMGQSKEARAEVDALKEINTEFTLASLGQWRPFRLYKDGSDLEKLKGLLTTAGLT